MSSRDSMASLLFTIAGIIIAIIGALSLAIALTRQIRVNEEEVFQRNLSVSGVASYDQEISLSPVSLRKNTKKILFLSSYDPTSAYYFDQIAGLLSGSDSNEIEFDVINMDSLKHHSESDIRTIERMVRDLLAEDHYYGLIVADDFALQFVMRHRDDFFKDLPVIFFGVQDFEFGYEAAKDPLVTGYLEDSNVSSTVAMALKLLPSTREVVAIYDNSLSGQAEGKIFESLAQDPSYEGIRLVSLHYDQYTDEELQKILSSYGDGTIILLLSAHLDKNDNYHTTVEISRTVAHATSVPVFHNSKGGYNNGLVAGRTTFFMDIAAGAVRTMHAILDEELDLSTVSVSSIESSGAYVASYQGMKRFGLSFDDLPEGTIILGAPVSFNEMYGQVFYPMALILVGFLLVIIGARLEVHKRKRMESDLRKTAERLRFANEHDSLTGVYTRQQVLDKLNEDVTNGREYALVLTDVNGMKGINETYGHSVGDRILKDIAAELGVLAKTYGGVVARYGGDAFLLVLPGRHLKESDPILDHVLEIVGMARETGLDTSHISASLGAANSESNAQGKDVLSWTETALARAKERGRSNYLLFTPKMQMEEHERETEKSLLLDAIQHDGLMMVYQPQVDTLTGKLVGFEALARMKNGALGPGTFIPIAEKNGWIRQIGRVTTELTVRQIGQWRKEGLDPPPVSINFSADQLGDTAYLSFLQDLLVAYEVPATAVRLEITESLCIQNRDAESFFKAAKAMHIQLMMDDFGIGYSSLSTLSTIPVDIVKVDKSLCYQYSVNKNAFFQDVIALVHDLGKRVVCEGIETRQEYENMKRLHSDYIQGYYFGKPESPLHAVETMRKETLFPEG
ncbi:MAG: EAL domain-containing protein [Sphaerochaetaceae bacterium]|nr:EAL domain-containing protein [Spirochaetales bacterium]MDY5499752.1 EAL domain-containing protein [Sphaerochaetaceae bacterium]